MDARKTDKGGLTLAVEHILDVILFIRGQKVILDKDLGSRQKENLRLFRHPRAGGPGNESYVWVYRTDL